MSLQDTPRAERLHIGLYGARNSGKSSLINALTGQKTALVSDVAGTTTDPVYKAMELFGVGPVVFIDTAGYDDEGELGTQRVEKTKEAARRTDIALILISDEAEIEKAAEWKKRFSEAKTPVILLLSQCDTKEDGGRALAKKIKAVVGEFPLRVSAENGEGIEAIRKMILEKLPEDYEAVSLTGDLVEPGDTVLLVMPQDIQAPKGRLILPQVQTIRDLLDRSCVVISVTTEKLDAALEALREPPSLIITDSQVFPVVYAKKPKGSRLTSFSVLMAHYKGDIPYFAKSVENLENLPKNARILIAEACTHNTIDGDIGRIKIPAKLRQLLGDGITVDVVAGADFPDDLTTYDLVIHCGACMFNRRYVLSRVAQAKKQGVPMTNYGIILARFAGILDRIELPGK
ncbi:[FeFe] hydrogenase H-cluster maturation GTPase HydF [Schwartzia succinivorans]|uniref:[FeFe] hydrogenase H-cluster maturation GTPase HydF n=1 Tax=Schwartzia succinivorans DSM 10502 TaxID=1123243 RepID=A0A1M4XI99_9FIRM|nr:[FeFe] hydrogenase H-cluster maturation GTPase HydF [Schwartzia succinivorans]SHE93397.1 [FeFe] hydrogenase H-cluster maturation GTPase HydF [Schwartzia succinivorans DSM 10502]